MYKLKITLKSDLCAASGQGFSNSIDTDVCYDNYGIPFIPARRIKGCLKEAANYIESDFINEIFGISGNSRNGSLKITNAVIENYQQIVDDISISSKISHKNMLEFFTSTRASTAIKNDTAKEGSLRFIRVVNKTSPLTSENLEFFADFEIDEVYSNEFSLICKSLKNIGFNRNRGFGAIKCEMIISEAKNKNYQFTFEDNNDYQINYLIQLENNIMVSSNNSKVTDEYISGSMVLGCLANNYLKKNKFSSEFENLFIKDNIAFSNLYISNKSGIDTMPSPGFMGQYKGEKEVINSHEKLEEDKDKTFKPFKNANIDYGMKKHSVKTETTYHFAKNNENNKLYTQTSIQMYQTQSKLKCN